MSIMKKKGMTLAGSCRTPLTKNIYFKFVKKVDWQHFEKSVEAFGRSLCSEDDEDEDIQR